MSGQNTAPKNEKHIMDTRGLTPSEVNLVPASTTTTIPAGASPHTPSVGASGGLCADNDWRTHSRREVNGSGGREEKSSVAAQNSMTSNEKCNPGKSSKYERVRNEEETQVEGAVNTQHRVKNAGITRLAPSISRQDSNSKNSETGSTSMATSEGKTGEAVTHILSLHLTAPDQHTELQPASSTESLPQPTPTPSDTPSPPHQPLDTLDASPCRPKSKGKRQKGLSSGKDGKDSDSSVSSRKRASKSKTKIKSKFAPGSLEYIEERLRGRIFSGWVEERQWVECVGGYRDVIEVDEWEMEMNHQLQTVISSIQGVKEGTKWINITPPRNGPYYCLWVLMDEPPTPGHYWYTITGVKLQPQFGLMISVKEIRSIHPHDGELVAARRARLKKASQGAARSELESVTDIFHDWAHQLSTLRPATVLSVITSTLTLSNIKETIRFLTVLLMTLVIGLVTFLKESHVVGLRFIREAGIFFHNATPFLQTLLGFFEKIIGGLYLLVAMVYRDFRRPSAPPPRFPPPPPLPPASFTSSPSPRPSTGPRAIQYVSPER